MIVIYTGEGKGKTSAALGQVVRGLGGGLNVICAQFMKRDGVAGEQVMLEKLLGKNYLAGGLGFFNRNAQFPRHRRACLETMEWINEKLRTGGEVCVLDESMYALNKGLILREEMEDLLRLADQHGVHLVLTGRDAPDWLVEQADIVTEMVSRKHHFSRGRAAVQGIEF